MSQLSQASFDSNSVKSKNAKQVFRVFFGHVDLLCKQLNGKICAFNFDEIKVH